MIVLRLARLVNQVTLYMALAGVNNGGLKKEKDRLLFLWKSNVCRIKRSIPLAGQKITRRQKDISRLLRGKKYNPPQPTKKDNAGPAKKRRDKKMLHFQNSVIIIKKISKYGFFYK